jgi:hypothetical protein
VSGERLATHRPPVPPPVQRVPANIWVTEGRGAPLFTVIQPDRLSTGSPQGIYHWCLIGQPSMGGDRLLRCGSEAHSLIRLSPERWPWSGRGLAR